MYDIDLKRVEKKLSCLIRKGFFNGNDVYLFGVSDSTRQIIQVLRRYSIEPKYILDNDKNKQGSYFSLVKTIPVEDAIKKADNNSVYLIYSHFWREMIVQLKNEGINRKRICQLYKKESALKYPYMIYRAQTLYHKFIKEYGKLPIFICPYTGTGDIYLIGTFWKQYLEGKGITNYIFIVALAITVGELGDKTFLASIGLGFEYPNYKLSLIAGAILGMVVSNFIAIAFGKFLESKISSKYIKIISSIVFIIFGIVGLWALLF